MHPEFFTVPILGLSIKTYGFCLTVGFLSAVWLAMRRGQRVKADPDRVLDIGFLALVFGVGGARLFYVIHYWKTDFAPQENTLLAIIDIRQGGLEFLGGFIGATLATLTYLTVKKLSIRLYFDIVTPAVMWGLGFGRLGCFFNGCCFGGLCVAPGAEQPQYAWAVRFPYGSPAHVRAWQERRATVPAELVNTNGLQPFLLPAATLNLSVEKREEPKRRVERLEAALRKAADKDADGPNTHELAAELKSAEATLASVRRRHRLQHLDWAQSFPSRKNPQRTTAVSELQDLAAQHRSPPVHPTQLYSSINAFLLSGLLSAVFYYRKRHGAVIGTLLVLYPISRVILEVIRSDNPHDTAGLTVSQFASCGIALFGVIFLVTLYKAMPVRSRLLTAHPA